VSGVDHVGKTSQSLPELSLLGGIRTATINYADPRHGAVSKLPGHPNFYVS
jgi:hypothetical protein